MKEDNEIKYFETEADKGEKSSVPKIKPCGTPKSFEKFICFKLQ